VAVAAVVHQRQQIKLAVVAVLEPVELLVALAPDKIMDQLDLLT
jgi:hypothetical protein